MTYRLPVVKEPIVFSAAHPIVIRPKEPLGFTLATDTGVVIVKCDVPFEDARFTLTPGPEPGNVGVTFDCVWYEHQLEAAK